MSSDHVIRARGLGKAYTLHDSASDWLKDVALRGGNRRQLRALRDVDLQIAHGEAVAIIGRNGSGKSTLLQLLCGTLRPSEGSLEVRGRVAALLELGAGFNPEFTGRENVYLNASVLGLSEAEIAERLPAIAEFAGIGDFFDRPVREYSSGMYARLAFAVNAHVDADILIIDEILSVGDIGFQQKCVRFLRDFRKKGTLLFVSHDEAAVLSLCERAVWLDRGAVQADGPAKDVCRRYHTSQARGLTTGADFRSGGAQDRRTAEVRRDRRKAPRKRVELFEFDPDGAWEGEGGARIERAGFHTQDEEPLDLAQGGEDVELRVACRAERAIVRPVVAFVLRNRLGQAVFGDDTYLSCRDAARSIEAGSAFAAAFRFQLPYLLTGDYSVEAFLFDGGHGDHRLLCRRVDDTYLRVHSIHIGGGLANIGAHETRLEFGTREQVDVG